MANVDLSADLSSHLSSKHLPPTPAWLDTFLANVRHTTPIAAIRSTATFRILSSDITHSLQPTSSSAFPSDILDASIRERKLTGPITVQVLDVEDTGSSRWSQVEAIEAQERGETTKGRQIIRVTENEDEEGHDAGSTQRTQTQRAQPNGSNSEKPSTGPHKLLLQDANGTNAYGIELRKLEKVNLDMAIGAKMVLKNAIVARGVVLLEPRCAEIIGGNLPELHKVWKESRKERLKKAAGIRDRPDELDGVNGHG